MHRVLIVIGDGTDVDHDTTRFEALRRVAEEKHDIELLALFQATDDPTLDVDDRAIRALVGPDGVQVVAPGQDLAAAAGERYWWIVSAKACPPVPEWPEKAGFGAPRGAPFPWRWFVAGTAGLSMIALSIIARVAARRRRARLASMIVRR